MKRDFNQILRNGYGEELKSERNKRPCPECSEQILATAKKCRACGSTVTPTKDELDSLRLVEVAYAALTSDHPAKREQESAPDKLKRNRLARRLLGSGIQEVSAGDIELILKKVDEAYASLVLDCCDQLLNADPAPDAAPKEAA